MQIQYTLDEVLVIAQRLLAHSDRCNVFTFTGSLGAGKTTLVRAMLSLVGVKEPITSPTFTYVNIYTNDQEKIIYHFDLYRIKTIDDFVASGFDEYLHVPKSLCFIEWPEVIMPLLQTKVCHVVIDYVTEHERFLTYTCN